MDKWVRCSAPLGDLVPTIRTCRGSSGASQVCVFAGGRDVSPGVVPCPGPLKLPPTDWKWVEVASFEAADVDSNADSDGAPIQADACTTTSPGLSGTPARRARGVDLRTGTGHGLTSAPNGASRGGLVAALRSQAATSARVLRLLPSRGVPSIAMKLKPSLYGGSPVTHMPADAVTNRAFSAMTPPVQRVDGYAQHFRELLQAEQPLDLTISCDHDLPSLAC